eukprot:COSAG01_NODE_528_length_15893_cov_49.094846_10_plen_73_part_00
MYVHMASHLANTGQLKPMHYWWICESEHYLYLHHLFNAGIPRLLLIHAVSTVVVATKKGHNHTIHGTLDHAS